MVKNKKKKNNKKKNENFFFLHNHAVLRHQTNTKLLVVAFLCDDDNKVSHPLVRSLVRSRSRYLMTFIIGVKSYMRVTNVTLDIHNHEIKLLIFPIFRYLVISTK